MTVALLTKSSRAKKINKIKNKNNNKNFALISGTVSKKSSGQKRQTTGWTIHVPPPLSVSLDPLQSNRVNKGTMDLILVTSTKTLQ